MGEEGGWALAWCGEARPCVSWEVGGRMCYMNVVETPILGAWLHFGSGGKQVVNKHIRNLLIKNQLYKAHRN